VGQALWLQQGYNLEFLGKSTFVPGLWAASAAFFLINCWILGLIVADIRVDGAGAKQSQAASQNEKKTR
jgi:phosphatidylinositol glycan class M